MLELSFGGISKLNIQNKNTKEFIKKENPKNTVLKGQLSQDEVSFMAKQHKKNDRPDPKALAATLLGLSALAAGATAEPAEAIVPENLGNMNVPQDTQLSPADSDVNYQFNGIPTSTTAVRIRTVGQDAPIQAETAPAPTQNGYFGAQNSTETAPQNVDEIFSTTATPLQTVPVAEQASQSGYFTAANTAETAPQNVDEIFATTSTPLQTVPVANQAPIPSAPMATTLETVPMAEQAPISSAPVATPLETVPVANQAPIPAAPVATTLETVPMANQAPIPSAPMATTLETVPMAEQPAVQTAPAVTPDNSIFNVSSSSPERAQRITFAQPNPVAAPQEEAPAPQTPQQNDQIFTTSVPTAPAAPIPSVPAEAPPPDVAQRNAVDPTQAPIPGARVNRATKILTSRPTEQPIPTQPAAPIETPAPQAQPEMPQEVAMAPRVVESIPTKPEVSPEPADQTSIFNVSRVSPVTENLSSSGFILPLESYTRISSDFGMRIHPISGEYSGHRGTDFAAPKGTPIYAAADGVVVDTVYDPDGYGENVVIKHNINGKEVYTLYAHAVDGSLTVEVGDTVKQGEQIAQVGSTGGSTGPHLHFEVYDYSKGTDWYARNNMNPVEFLDIG